MQRLTSDAGPGVGSLSVWETTESKPSDEESTCTLWAFADAARYEVTGNSGLGGPCRASLCVHPPEEGYHENTTATATTPQDPHIPVLCSGVLVSGVLVNMALTMFVRAPFVGERGHRTIPGSKIRGGLLDRSGAGTQIY